MTFLRLILSIILLSSLINSTSKGQEDQGNISFGKYRKIHSKILDEDRNLLVSLPENYDQSNKRYPVIYQLDGWESQYLKGIAAVQRLKDENRIPEVIYVAIANTDRNRDMLPFKSIYHRTSGGADSFIRFLNEEAVPFINNNYRTTSYRSIIGFSNSAQFLIYMLAVNPESFSSYVAISPSLAWDYDFYRKRLEKLFSERDELKIFLSLVYGGGEGQSFYGDQHYFDIGCVDSLARLCREKAPRGFEWDLNIIEGARHVPPTSIYEGVKAIFPAWKLLLQPDILPSGGFLAPHESIIVKMKSNVGMIRFTTDGAEPTYDSQIYDKEIMIDKPTIVKAKAFIENLDEGQTATAIFEHSLPLQPSTNVPQLQSGLNYNYYEDYFWYRLPEFKDIDPVDSGIAAKINLNHSKRREGFAFEFEGYINIGTTGDYIFYLKSNHESIFILGDKTIIHKEPSYELEEKSGRVSLEKGFHKIEVLYVGPPFQRKLELQCSYESDEIERQELPRDILFHKSDDNLINK